MSRLLSVPSVAPAGLVLSGLLAAVLLLSALSASAVQFPSPSVLELPAAANCALAVRFPGQDRDEILVGLGDGSLSLYNYIETSRIFQPRQRLILAGAVVSVVSWDGRPLADPGVVVATANPDRVVFVRTSPVYPHLVVEAAVDLEEDPGDMAFVGHVLEGKGELAVALPGLDQVAMLAADGGWHVAALLDTGDRPLALVAADLDGDQVREIVTADAGPLSQSLSVFRQDAAATWGRSTAALAGVAPLGVVARDLDGDGRDDLAVLDAVQPAVTICAEEGGVVVETARVTLQTVAQSLGLATLADGTPVLLAAAEERGLMELHTRGPSGWQRQGAYYPGSLPHRCLAADLDGNGLPDAVSLAGEAARLTALPGLPGPALSGYPVVILGSQPGQFLETDLDGDGRLDLLVGEGQWARISFFPGGPDGRLATEPTYLPLSFGLGEFAQVQADGDAAPELAMIDAAHLGVAILDHVAGVGLVEIGRASLGASPRRVVAADVDHDGHDDLLVGVGTGGLVDVLFGLGDGTFTAPTVLVMGSALGRLRAVDLDGDQLLEVVATDGLGRVWWRASLGGRTFGSPRWINAGAGATDLECGDLDGDLDLDLVVANRTDETLTFYENDGQGNLVLRVAGRALPGPPSGLALGLVDDDLELDVVVPLAEQARFTLVPGAAGWNFGESDPGGPDMGALGILDFDRDGRRDILAMDQSLNLGLAIINDAGSQVAVAPPELAAACAGDGLAVTLRPASGAPWRLTWEGPDGGRLVADAAGVRYGVLAPCDAAWCVHLDADDRAALGEDGRLTLVWGEGAARRSRTVAVPSCDEAAGATFLAWSREPWPNPANPGVRADFRLARPAAVDVAVYDLAGRRVATLWRGPLDAGEHALRWDGRAGGGAAAAGVYLLRVATPDAALTRKLSLLK